MAEPVRILQRETNKRQRMARGRQRIRQRGSRQQWAQARNFKTFGDESTLTAVEEIAPPPLIAGAVPSLRCGRCTIVVEQRLSDGTKQALLPYALCIICDETRCEECW